MGQGKKFGLLRIKTTTGSVRPFTTLVVPDGTLMLEGADEAHLSITGATWVELAVSTYADIAAAVTAIGATPATLVIDTPETVSTALSIPATLFLRIAKGASLTKSGSGTITFLGLGIEDAKSQIPLFFGFAVGDITWTGTLYPKEVSLELWDTANTSLSDRLERAAAAFNNGSKAVKFIAYPRVITKSVELFDWQSIHFTPGEYTNTATGHPATFPQFLLNDHCGMTADTGAIIYESDSPSNAHIISAKMMYVAGSSGTVEDIQIRDLYIKGHASQTHNGLSSTIILGNSRNSSVRNVTLDGTHAYGITVGGYSTIGNYAENVDITDIRILGVGTQLLNVINGRDITFRNIHIDVRNHNATGSFTCIDIEPNTTDNKAENITVENVFIDARTTITGIVMSGVTMQAANAPVMINPVVRNVTVLGLDISTSGATAGQLSAGVAVYGATGGVIENIYIQGSTQDAIFAQTCRYTKFRNCESIQCNAAGGFAVTLQACASCEVEGIILDESYTPFAQLTNMHETEAEFGVTSSASTVTEYAPGGNPRFYSHLVALSFTLNNTNYVIDTLNPTTFSLTTTVAVGTLTVKTFASATDVNTGTEVITIASHGHNTGSRVRYLAGTAPVGGLTNGTTYFVIASTAGTLKLATTLANALAGTPIDLTSTGTGTQTLVPVLITKFSSNEFWANKAEGGIVLEPTGTSVVHNTYKSNPQDYIAPANSTALAALASSPLDTLLGTITNTPIDPVTWSNMVYVTQSGADNKLTRTTGGGAFDAGAFSVESIPEGGYLEVTNNETTTYKAVGLSYTDTNQHYNTIEYAVLFEPSGNVSAYRLGTAGANVGYTTGTVIRLTRVGNTIEISKDGAAPFQTYSSVAADGLHVDTCLYDNGATVGGVLLGGIGNVETLVRADVQEIVGIISATASLNFDLTAVVSQDLTIALTGAAVGDVVIPGIPAGSVTADTQFMMWVSAADVVTVRASRLAGTPDPASGTFRATIIKV